MFRYASGARSLVLAALVCGMIAWPAAAGHAAPMKTPLHARALSPGAATTKVIPGWPGGNAKYIGRYHLVTSNDPALATGGELVVFLRMNVPHQPKPILGGILTMTSKTQTNVLYLTKFAHAGTKLWTTVNLGIYTGPILGQFKVTSLKGSQLAAEIVQQGATPVALQFVRFSTNPHP